MNIESVLTKRLNKELSDSLSKEFLEKIKEKVYKTKEKCHHKWILKSERIPLSLIQEQGYFLKKCIYCGKIKK